MDRDFESIASDAEHLPPDERYKLAERLVSGLWPSASHVEQWVAESKKRAAAYDRGEIKGHDVEDVMKEVRRLRQR